MVQLNNGTSAASISILNVLTMLLKFLIFRRMLLEVDVVGNYIANILPNIA